MTYQTVRATKSDERAEVEHVLARQHERLRRHARRELEERHDRAGEGHRADEDADEDLGVVDVGSAPAQAGVVERAVPADEHGGEADEAVQQGDELGHPGHLDDARAPEADRGADQHGHDEQAEAERVACGVAPGVRRTVSHDTVATSAIAMPAMP